MIEIREQVLIFKHPVQGKKKIHETMIILAEKLKYVHPDLSIGNL